MDKTTAIDILNNRLEPLLTAHGISISLEYSIAWAVRAAGGSTSDYSSATDVEVASVNGDKLLDFAEYRTIENVLNNLTTTDFTSGPISEKLSQLADRLRDRLAKLKGKIDELYGFTNSMEAGVINLAFAES